MWTTADADGDGGECRSGIKEFAADVDERCSRRLASWVQGGIEGGDGRRAAGGATGGGDVAAKEGERRLRVI